ncbi:MAG: HAD-IA family hydrolase [Deltaproteobacteria bacterium]|jgi:beta-phosphoglucomutase family hydrolase|nr:HAD-IA family hydrolase [Deltaproteobacteria bacterium]MBW2534795.1 HAD-IA family hydrolase [Deltaproteobacteria bacterium]
MSELSFEAAIFDLDGVVTRTARVHSRAWKETFDAYLRVREERDGEPFEEFTHERDYRRYVDGKPRFEGVASFLAARGIALPRGTPEDSAAAETICGLGNRKNERVNELLAEGIEPFPSTVALIEELRAAGVRIGVASSSENCQAMLEAAGVAHLFETRVDGRASAELGLRGKPAPDYFLTACERLRAVPERSVVVEDAVSGIRAGTRANFGLVLGIAREGNHGTLDAAGADRVVSDLAEIDAAALDDWFRSDLAASAWTLRYSGLDPAQELKRESLCTVGNGYLATRGALEECTACPQSYAGTYLAGVYDRLPSEVAGRTIENEDLVNAPNWLPLTFRVDDGPWVDPAETAIVVLRRTLDLRTGVLHRKLVVRDDRGRETAIVSERLASMAEPHLAALRYRITPLNYSGTIRFRSRLDGDVQNLGVERYRSLSSRHLEPATAWGAGADAALSVRTRQSQIEIALAAHLQLFRNGRAIEPRFYAGIEPARVSTELEVEAEQGDTITVDKLVALYTSRDPEPEPLAAARALLHRAESYPAVARPSADRWSALWDDWDIEIEGDRRSQLLLRLHAYHLLCSASPHNAALDASIGARGLHGEAYRGHVFWDVSFVLPLYSMHLPEAARSLLMYRVRRLSAARQAASEEGLAGAMLPWQSGSDGREETQELHLNPRSGEWGPDHSRRQRHVSLAVALDLWSHHRIAGDEPFLVDHGAELLLEICRFWSSLAREADGGLFDIAGVMGPDEYHEVSPASGQPGLTNNAYTNLMVAWVMGRALDLLEALPTAAKDELLARLEIDRATLERFRALTQRLHLLIADGLLEQFEGYADLQELDWDRYRRTYGDIHRLDRILKAEGDSPDRYRVAKQADALMARYWLPPDELDRLIAELGCGDTLDGEFWSRNFDHYLTRTCHGSTLSKVVYAKLAAGLGRLGESFALYTEALESDYVDVQGGTTGEGIHAGVMGATLWTAITAYGGVDPIHTPLRIAPALPETWRAMRFAVRHQGHRIEVQVDRDAVQLRLARGAPALAVEVVGRHLELSPGEWRRAPLPPPPPNDRRDLRHAG